MASFASAFKNVLQGGAKKKPIPENPLILSCLNGNLDDVINIIDKKDLIELQTALNFISLDGRSGLICAIEVGHNAIAKYLIQKGAATHIQKKNGDTALILASGFGNLDVVTYLVEGSWVNLDVRGNRGDTALIRASANGHLKIVSLLLHKGASTTIKNNANMTAKDVAATEYVREAIILHEALKAETTVDAASNTITSTSTSTPIISNIQLTAHITTTDLNTTSTQASSVTTPTTDNNNRIINGFKINFHELKTSKPIQVYCMSDLHADSKQNLDWIRSHDFHTNHSKDRNKFSIFICPGDIGANIVNIREVFISLKQRYDLVSYVPGNHEAWTTGGLKVEGCGSGGGGYNSTSSTSDSSRSAGGGNTKNRHNINSPTKLHQILQCAVECGVYVGPVRITMERGTDRDTGRDRDSGLVIFPLYSWYHSGFDREPDLNDPDYLEVENRYPFERRWGDFNSCVWPESIVSETDFKSITKDSLALPKAFALINEPFLPQIHKDIDTDIDTDEKKPIQKPIRMDTKTDSSGQRQGQRQGVYIHPGDSILSFSHFVPRQELCPEKRLITDPYLSRVIGSDVLEEQIRRLKPHLHMFGHTHIPIDMTLEGQRYLQWSLGYPAEATRQCGPVLREGPLLVFDSSLGDGTRGIPSEMPSTRVWWSMYYASTSRDPDCMVLAPYLREKLKGKLLSLY
eukprot:gene9320-19348_t